VDFTTSDLVGAIVGTIVGDVVDFIVAAVVGEADGALVVRFLVGLADFTGLLEGFGAVVGLLVGRRADASKEIGTGNACASTFLTCCFSRRA
jgi:sorbitol-specific phosphotransferase system component IIBC